METRGVARRTAAVARLLMSVSLFCVLIWWWIGVELFTAGALLYVAAAVLERRIPAVVGVPE